MQKEPNIDDGSWASNGKHIIETLKRLTISSDTQETQLREIHTIVTKLTTQRDFRVRVGNFISGLIPTLGILAYFIIKNIPRAK